MTKEEFMYDHDLESIIDLIERHNKYTNGESTEERSSQSKGDLEVVEDVRGFFI